MPSVKDALKAIDQIVPRHSYGLVQAVENMRALVIIENTITIRAILSVLKKLDVPAQPEIQKSFQLTRADAEEVSGALSEILEQEEWLKIVVINSNMNLEVPTNSTTRWY